MRMSTPIWLGFLMLIASCAGWAQGDTTQAPTTAPPPPAFGQGLPPTQVSETPPLSGLDEPSLEPAGAARSFLLYGGHVGEVVDTNSANSLGGNAVAGVTRVVGNASMQRLWSRYELALDYVGGANFYSNRSSVNHYHNMSATQRMLWRTGAIQIRDYFSYLPDGSFGYGAFGGTGGIPGGSVGGGRIPGLGFGQFGSLGNVPRINNLAAVDVQQRLSPRSAFTLAGGYGILHFTDSSSGGVGSRQFTGQMGYGYALSRRNKVALTYAYQGFRYPDLGNSFNTHVVQVLFGHQISGRMSLQIGGGPQFTQFSNSASGSGTRVSGSGRASLHYRFPKTSLGLLYDHYTSGGSGFFLGSDSDIVRFTAGRPLGRQWHATGDVGFSRNSRVQQTTAGSPAKDYAYVYTGVGLSRNLGRNFGLSFNYHYNGLAFDSSVCVPGQPCNRNSGRHLAGFGLDWHPRPIRLD